MQQQRRKLGWKSSSRIVKAVCVGGVFTMAGASGCKSVDPGEVAKFAASSEQVKQASTRLTQDFSDSCERGVRFGDLSVTPFAFSATETKVQAECGRAQKVEELLVSTNGVLVNYLVALGKVASDETVTYDKSLQTFASSLTATEAFSEPKVTSVQNLSGFILKAINKEVRRKALAQAIQTRNADVRALATFLQSSVGGGYVTFLEAEESSAKTFYETRISDLSTARSDNLSAVVKEYLAYKTETASRKRAAESYKALLTTVIATHDKLATTKLNSREVRLLLADYAATAQPLIREVRTAFRSSAD